jgi:phosphohistidine phosphatase
MASENKKKRGNAGSGKKRLYLLRHAKAVLGGGHIDDMPRALAEQGHQQMAALVEALADKRFHPDLALVSPSRRTVDTLERLRPRLVAARVDLRDDLYLASAAALMEILRGLDEGQRAVLLIGHNPGLHELALSLLAPESPQEKPKLTRRLFHGFPTGALAEFECAGPWSALIAGHGKLRRFLRPKDLFLTVEG